MNISFFMCIILLATLHVALSDLPWPILLIMDIGSFGLNQLRKGSKMEEDYTQIYTLIKNVSTEIAQAEQNLKTIQETIIHELSVAIDYHQAMHDLRVNGIYIDDMFDRFHVYYDVTSTYEDGTLLEFARSCTSHGTDQLPNVINLIYNLIEPFGFDDVGLFDLLVQKERSKDQQSRRCNATISVQQELYLMYHIVTMYVIKGFTMRLYAYHVLRKLVNGQYATEIGNIQSEYLDVVTKISQKAVEAMKGASREIHRCDPEVHKEGETYHQLKWVFGVMYTNEIYLSENADCSSQCNEYEGAIFHSNNFHGRPERCNGKVYNCAAHGGEVYCESTSPYRRYNGIKEFSSMWGDTYPAKGNTSKCIEKELNPVGHDVPAISVGGHYHSCDQCKCICDDYDYSETVRTFSLRGVESDVENGIIITGVRLVEKQKVFHIQIQQGKLAPNFTVDVSTLRWKPVDEFDYRDPSVPNTDYYTITTDNNKIALDTYTIESGLVLTGVKFINRHDTLQIAVKASLMDLKHGNVREVGMDWYFNDISFEKQVPIETPHIPILAKKENVINAEAGGFLKFRESDWMKDASQTTVPYLDIQPVVSNPPLPLGGFGLYYKGQENFGGFLGLKILSYDYSILINHEILPTISRPSSQ